MKLAGKKILLGITGSIAAYKAIDLLRFLQKEGAEVQVMVTKSALQFVTKVTLEALSGHEVLEDIFEAGKVLDHVRISRKVDLILIAPTTANMLAKLAYGMADSFLAAAVLASNAPVIIAPAMNTKMWQNYLVRENVKKLKKAGYLVMDTQEGLLACGERGEGRFHAIELIGWQVIKAITVQDLKGKFVLITAGATREYLDPVRFMANGSSGKMGVRLAFEAFFRGAKVVLVAANLDGLRETDFPFEEIAVTTAAEMLKVVSKTVLNQDVFISAAAVADFCFKQKFKNKMNKVELLNGRRLNLVENIDILAEVIKVKGRKAKPFLIGFALETDHDAKQYRHKFDKKPVNLLVCTDPNALGSDQIEADLLDRKSFKQLGLVSKEVLSEKVFDTVVKVL